MRCAAVVVALALATAPPAVAHDGVVHATPADAAAHASDVGPALPFPIEIRPRFDLLDQTGQRMTDVDLSGRPAAIFFGYASCEAICSVALPTLGRALDIAGDDGAAIVPLLITVDPARDTPAAMRAALAEVHPRLVGLTGTEAEVAAARAAFQVEANQVATDPDGEPIYAHGSFIYLVGRDGVVKSVLPPILGPERVAEVMLKHL